MVDLLIKYGADVNHCHPLERAIQKDFTQTGAKSIAKKLIEAGADPDAITTFNSGCTVRQFAQVEAARRRNQDYIEVFKPESKL